MTSPCAGTNTIAALIAGAANASATHELEDHLDGCAACRQLVADLGRGLSAIGDGAHAPAPGRLPRAGERVGRYEIRRVVGVGGMGVVYEARDTTLDRRVAIKLLRPDVVPDVVDEGGGQLLGEAQAMARLHHPNIAMVHDVGMFHGQLYVCMEYVTGKTLRDWLAERSRTWRQVLEMFVAAGRGLAYVHRAGLVHLDFKPDNVLVCQSGRVVVTDFGLARMIRGQRPRHGPRVAVGTPAYMAPEQRLGDATDARTDQFGFCAALLEGLGGRRTGASGVVVDAPGWLRRAIARGLAVRAADRFASMDALLAACERAVQSPRRRLVGGVIVGLAAALAVVANRPAVRVTEVIDHPVVHTVAAPASANAAPEADGPRGPDAGSTAPAAIPALTAATRSAFDPGVLRGMMLAPEVSLAGARFDQRAVARAPGPSSTEPHHDGDASSQLPGQGTCDDGTDRVCAIDEPACPTSTVAAIQDGCWTCAETASCAPLGLPKSCNDGSRLTCTAAEPVCASHQIVAVRNGCWRCEDAFTCASHSAAVPPKPKKPPPIPSACGNGRCDVGETHASCPSDCASGSGGGSGTGGGSGSGTGSGGGARCGNGFCEIGEDHASCAADCCEVGPSGACAAICGNGFCEAGEDHASCAGDCCEVTASGACVAVCGNGFCEIGEDAQHCPADCP